MKTYNTQKEVNADLDRDGNLTIKDDVTFLCNVTIDGDIKAHNIDARNITAHDIKAHDIDALMFNADKIFAHDIDALNITARNIKAHNIDALNIFAHDIDAWDIKAHNIKAHNIDARNINARNIDAENIFYDSRCVAQHTFFYKSIKGHSDNAKHVCLNAEIAIKG